ncbi:MAG: hypothetical protein GY716_20970 [bacterium]|nr:hypothetical protein [bacterium]
MKLRNLLVVLVVSLIAGLGSVEAGERMWFGGGLGFGLGDVEFIEVSPTMGFEASEDWTVGFGVVFRYHDDNRFSEGSSTTDYGADVWVRYHIKPTLYVHAEYEYLSYEFLRFDFSTDRDTFHSILAGPGFYKQISDRTGFYAQALYNFSYDDDEISPYDDEWVYGVGVTFGF